VGNISASYFLGNGSLLTGIDATSIQNGTSNVRVVSSGGNVTVGIGGTANVAVYATTGEFITGLISATGNVIGGNVSTGGVITATGNITGGNVSTGGLVTATGNVNSGNVNTAGLVSAGANVIGGNISTGGLVTATGNVNGGNIISAAAISAGGLISAVGTVTGGNLDTNGTITTGSTVSATGNVTGGNFNTAGLVSATGNVTNGIANVLTGNAIVTSLVSGATLSASGNVISGNLNAAGLSLSGNVVSSLSMITNITTTANIAGGNISTAGNLEIPTAAANTNTTQAATTAFVVGQAGGLSPVAIGSAVVGTSLKYAREDHNHSGVTSVSAGTAISVSATTGALTVTNTGVTSAVAGTGVGVSAATGAVTISIGQAVATGSSPTFAGITLPSITKSGTNGVGDIGAVASTFATVYATTFSGVSTTAKYADLAENYSADAAYPPGTVLSFGGTHEVTLSTKSADSRVAGVVSTHPAHLMNSMLKAEHVTALALTGRVPALVVGTVRKGDMMVSAGNGHAQACATPAMGTVIGKAVEDFNGNTGTIEIVVGRI
jgi:hypothetical protein